MSKPKKQITALDEKDGISNPEIISPKAIAQIQQHRKTTKEASELIEGIFNGEMSSLSRAITLIESTNKTDSSKANAVISACLKHSHPSVRIGITGVPGVGKSTFIEALGKFLTRSGKKVAVLAIDPSSSISHGSILGDKTRMEELVKDPLAFIRPSPSATTLGGVSRKTRETIFLCEAFGFDVILIETVGVGQSETAAHGMVDFFLLLKLAGAGDALQGIKRGIIELADAIVVNKADGDQIHKARLDQAETQRALAFFPAKKNGWIPVATSCSALHKEGISEIWQIIEHYIALTQANHSFEEKRKNQNKNWLFDTVNESLLADFYNLPAMQSAIKSCTIAVQNNSMSPFEAAEELLNSYRHHKK